MASSRKLIVEVVGDTSGFVHSLEKAGTSTKAFQQEVTRVAASTEKLASAEAAAGSAVSTKLRQQAGAFKAVSSAAEKAARQQTEASNIASHAQSNAAATAEKVARAQVSASVKVQASLRQQVAAFREIAGAAERGSREQVAAAQLASRAEQQLARSMGTTAREARELSASAARAERSFGQFGRGALAGSGAMRGLGRSLAFASAGFLSAATAASVIRSAFSELGDAAKVAAQTNAVLKSTGGAANVTAGQVDKLGNSLLRVSGVDDELIKSAENVLLTFRSIRNEAGAGNDVFNQATKATLDLSVALGKDLPEAALLVGKALNDPARGFTALRRSGVQFTTEQEKLIKSLVKTGQTMQAQKIILRELNIEFGGSAAAAGNAAPWNRLRETFRNFTAEVVSGSLPAIRKMIAQAQAWLDNENNLAATQRTVASALHITVAAIQAFVEIVRVAKAVLSPFVSAVGGLRTALLLAAGAFTAFKIAGLVTALSGLRLGFAGVGTAAAAAGATGAASMTNIATAAGVASFAITTMILHVSGLDKKLRGLGSAAHDFAASIGLAAKTPSPFQGGQGNPFAGKVPAAGARALTPDDIEKLRRSQPQLSQHDFEILLKAALNKANAGTHGSVGGFVAGSTDLGRQASTALSAVAAAAAQHVKIPAAKMNQFFDALIQRQLGKVQDIGSASGQLAALDKIAALIKARIGKTKDVTRLATLEDQLLAVRRQAKEIDKAAFASIIDRKLSRVQDIEGATGQLAALDQIAALIRDRMAKTKNVSDLADLEDKLLEVRRQQKGERAQIAQDFIASLQLNIDKAGLTTTLTDDLAALGALAAHLQHRIATERDTVALQQQLVQVQQQMAGVKTQMGQDVLDALSLKLTKAEATKGLNDDLAVLAEQQAALRKRIKSEGATLDLQRQLFDVQQQIKAKGLEKRATAQFGALGLGPSGEDLAPTVAAIRKNVQVVQNALAKAGELTPAARAKLANIRKVLSGALGAVGDDVRNKMKSILDDLFASIDSIGSRVAGAARKARNPLDVPSRRAADFPTRPAFSDPGLSFGPGRGFDETTGQFTKVFPLLADAIKLGFVDATKVLAPPSVSQQQPFPIPSLPSGGAITFFTDQQTTKLTTAMGSLTTALGTNTRQLGKQTLATDGSQLGFFTDAVKALRVPLTPLATQAARPSAAAPAAAGGGDTFVYSPTINSPDLQGAERLARRDYFRARQVLRARR